MGYSTKFTGTLNFKQEPTASQLAHLNTILGEDARDHGEWKPFVKQATRDRDYHELCYIDLELTPDFTGIRWNNAEKTYDMVECVNLITLLMRLRWPEFELTGELQAQGDEIDDAWRLQMVDGFAVKRKMKVEGTIIRCPQCDHKFILKLET